MKQPFNFRNEIALTAFCAGLWLTSSAFTIGPADAVRLVDNAPQKKVQRMKVFITKDDGKATIIDTTFNLPDEKIAQDKADSIIRNLDIDKVGPKSKVFIFRDGKGMKSFVKADKNMPGDEQLEVIVQDSDSDNVIPARKMMRIRGVRSEALCNDEFLPPPPPMPPMGMSHSRFHQGGDSYAFDTKDESVISYEKKDMGDGTEKITIIRKKRDAPHAPKEVKVKAVVSVDSKK
ncbi:MAG: hypothetical protein WCL21_09900 [Mariniphaga sp.]